MNNSDSDHSDLELPKTGDVSRYLFTEEVENLPGGSEDNFDIDSFLIKNNFHYLSLDKLIRDVTGLSDEILNALLGQMSSDYDYYLGFFKMYNSRDDEALVELQKTKVDIESFLSDLDQVTRENLLRVKETISDTVYYLKELDSMSSLLKNHEEISERLTIGKELSRTLHELCGIEQVEETLCSDLVPKLNTLVTECKQRLSKVESLNSPLAHHFRNEYQGLVQDFQISSKILVDKCLEKPEDYPDLSAAFVSLFTK